MAICKNCKTEFEKKISFQIYCKERCKQEFYYARDKDKMIARAKQWQKDNKEKHKVSCKKWWKASDKTALYSANYRLNKFNATPSWIDKKEVSKIYKLAKERGLVVDHIVPVNSPNVCGLHCEDNLRCIPQNLNSHKANNYWPDM